MQRSPHLRSAITLLVLAAACGLGCSACALPIGEPPMAKPPRRAAGAPSPAVEPLDFPELPANGAAYHARARLVFDTALGILQALTSNDSTEVALEAMEADGFGFTHFAGWGGGSTVSYQDPWLMDESALTVNRAVTQVSDPEELEDHMQMMLYWFLPHEVVHVFTRPSGWRAEYVANAVQPYLTERVLKTIETPYTAAFMRRVYDRYVVELRRAITDDEAAAVEAYVRSGGAGDGPFDRSAWEIFQENTALYVYFGARINQDSLGRGLSLERVVEEYLKP